ncbi:hypothetical protein [Sanguibacter sp. 25GB23B1]|uniref:hypothetical protein n=1 Tax=unclassified Sanguibacter TaxID=2645534 RepID=UPI0032AF7FEA
MDEGTTSPLEDDERVPMTMNERTAWAYLVTVVVTSGAYLTLMGTRLTSTPVSQIDWVVPMLWTIGASVVCTVLLTILLTITGTLVRTIWSACFGPREASTPLVDVDTSTDARDTDIDAIGDRAGLGILGAGFLGALVLAMLDADTFWIGNTLFAFGTLGAIVESTTKLRIYRRGF